MTQTEAQLEESLIAQLERQGYERVTIRNEQGLLANLLRQLEAHNDIRLSAEEFGRILAHLDRGNVFERAKTLRDRFNLTRDDNSTRSIQFLNCQDWCRNRFQVTNQITQIGNRENRYDVTILINGFPLVHIELKRRGLELSQAFNQINRYHRDSFASGHGLFQYVQIFAISNGVNTRYYANQRKQTIMQSFKWAGKDNKHISRLCDFAESFLDKCHIAKMISRHIVLHESDKILMVLRPYQVHAVEAIIERVRNTRNGGYIWHTTGSGKTLTSFKAAQLLSLLPEIEKVVFVVDRLDLDYQTMREFNAFQKDAVDGSDDTASLVEHFANPNSKIIVTTIQKLNKAISAARHNDAMQAYQDKRVVLIFDECHRSQFGQTHHRIKDHFKQAQKFGFTGTPIKTENAVMGFIGADNDGRQKKTTEMLFGDCLHRYIITDAIHDKNVLPFSIDYWGRLKRANGDLIDEKVVGLNTKEYYENKDRISKICDSIIQMHSGKTHQRSFTSILAVSSIDAACTYYDRLKALYEADKHDLRVVTIFSSPINEDDSEADGHLPAEEPATIEAAPVGTTARARLDSYIKDYNHIFGTEFNTRNYRDFYNYYRDIGKRIKAHDKEGFRPEDRIDILLVVNMFLTGFDAKKLNTLYVDKNLRYHGLIQAFSRTNRIFNKRKSHGNIVCFRNLKQATDDAIALFADTDSSDIILVKPYQHHVDDFNRAALILLQDTPTPQSVDNLADEDAQGRFINSFRELIRILNKLKGFADFKWSDLSIPKQRFEDFKSKYLDLYDEVQRHSHNKDKASILQDVDFEIELLRRDEINLKYILDLLQKMLAHKQSGDIKKQDKVKNTVLTLLDTQVQLRSKRELVERFIKHNMSGLSASDNVEQIFSDYMETEKQIYLSDICKKEHLRKEHVEAMIAAFNFTGKEPLGEDVFNAMTEKPRILERRHKINSATMQIMDLVNIFETA